MTELRSYDVIVLGAGPAGENAGDYARQHGLSVVIVERELVGGECSYWACIPSKSLLHPTEVLAAAARVPALAGLIPPEVDAAAVLRARDEAVSGWSDAGQVDWLAGVGIDLVRGHGRLAGERRVEVTTEDGDRVVLEAVRAVVLATGSAPARPVLEGLDAVGAWTSRDVTAMRSVPDRLLVLGGGVVGVEMAQAVRRLGANEVTIVQSAPQLLRPEEPFVGEVLADALRAEGITVLTDTRAERVERPGADGPLILTLADGRALVGDELLVATGRVARTDDLGLRSVGVVPGRKGHLAVDERLRVPGHEWLYVVGDTNGRALLTHQGKYQARLVGDTVAGVAVDAAWADERAVPRVVFTDPQVAAVGWTERRAREAGVDVLTVRYDVGNVAGGSLRGPGFGGPAQLVVDRDRRTIVGATFVGPDVGELLHAATIAIVGEVTVDRLAHAVPAFPTVSEVWLRLLEEVRRVDLAAGSGSG